MDDTRQRNQTNSAGRGSGSQKTLRGAFNTSAHLQQHQKEEHTKTDPTKQPTTRRQDKEAGRAAGAERRHQHRSNPTQRTGKGGARRQYKTGENGHTRTREGTKVLTGLNRRPMVFFRPSPSRLSPGRHTVFVLMNELDNAWISIPHWGVERGARTITQSGIHNGVRPKAKQNKKKNKATTKPTTKPNKTKRPVPRSKDELRRSRQLMCQWIKKILQTSKKQPNRHHSKIAVQTDQQRRNPGSPGSRRSHWEARAPSLAWSSHALNWEATQRQAPYRGKQPRNKRGEKSWKFNRRPMGVLDHQWWIPQCRKLRTASTHQKWCRVLQPHTGQAPLIADPRNFFFRPFR